MSQIGDPKAEGVMVMLPVPELGPGHYAEAPEVRALRYSSRDAVPWWNRWNARQVGAAGYWYVPIADTPQDLWDKATGKAATVINDVAEATGAEGGLLGIAAKLTGVNPMLLLVLVVLALLGVSGAGSYLSRSFDK